MIFMYNINLGYNVLACCVTITSGKFSKNLDSQMINYSNYLLYLCSICILVSYSCKQLVFVSNIFYFAMNTFCNNYNYFCYVKGCEKTNKSFVSSSPCLKYQGHLTLPMAIPADRSG